MKNILNFVGDEFASLLLWDAAPLEIFDKVLEVDGLADVEGDLPLEPEDVGLNVGQDFVHALVPHGQHHGDTRRLVDDAADAPLQTHLLLGDVDLALGEHVHPVVLRQFLDAEVDGLLVDATSSHHGNAFA